MMWAGLLIMIVSETATLLRVEPFWSWHTPIAWTGYIFFVDALVRQRRGDSLLPSAPAEAAFIGIAGIPLWVIFEAYNAYALHNWYNAHAFIVDDASLRDARLALATATRQVIANGLDLLGVSAPEKM